MDNNLNQATATKPEPGELAAAAKKGDLDAMKDLIQRGANVNERDQFGGAVLMWAMQVSNKELDSKRASGKECVRLLLDNGAVIDKRLMDYAEKNAPVIVVLLRDVARQRALHAAAVKKRKALEARAPRITIKP